MTAEYADNGACIRIIRWNVMFKMDIVVAVRRVPSQTDRIQNNSARSKGICKRREIVHRDIESRGGMIHT